MSRTIISQATTTALAEGSQMSIDVDTADFDPRDLRAAFGQFATGVTVVTTVTPDGERIGVTANSFTSLSMDPPLVLWCPGRHLRSLPAFETATHFAINVLASNQHGLSGKFATGSTDKFDGVAVREGIAGIPVLEGTLATFECETVARHEAGDHVIYVGQIRRYAHAQAKPLVFHGGSYHGTTTHTSEDA
ncbi:flavin reductase family protein [Leucobacter sp. NPDC058333]|uniref:flavin reductase family protein n=1 Tax=Leucobacter sp. NPDC058333 TaxID=3346450 RepID=UPI003664A67F